MDVKKYGKYLLYPFAAVLIFGTGYLWGHYNGRIEGKSIGRHLERKEISDDLRGIGRQMEIASSTHPDTSQVRNELIAIRNNLDRIASFVPLRNWRDDKSKVAQDLVSSALWRVGDKNLQPQPYKD